MADSNRPSPMQIGSAFAAARGAGRLAEQIKPAASAQRMVIDRHTAPGDSDQPKRENQKWRDE
jgi:hypothetical protein